MVIGAVVVLCVPSCTLNGWRMAQNRRHADNSTAASSLCPFEGASTVLRRKTIKLLTEDCTTCVVSSLHSERVVRPRVSATLRNKPDDGTRCPFSSRTGFVAVSDFLQQISMRVVNFPPTSSRDLKTVIMTTRNYRPDSRRHLPQCLSIASRTSAGVDSHPAASPMTPLRERRATSLARRANCRKAHCPSNGPPCVCWPSV